MKRSKCCGHSVMRPRGPPQRQCGLALFSSEQKPPTPRRYAGALSRAEHCLHLVPDQKFQNSKCFYSRNCEGRTYSSVF